MVWAMPMLERMAEQRKYRSQNAIQYVRFDILDVG